MTKNTLCEVYLLTYTPYEKELDATSLWFDNNTGKMRLYARIFSSSNCSVIVIAELTIGNFMESSVRLTSIEVIGKWLYMRLFGRDLESFIIREKSNL